MKNFFRTFGIIVLLAVIGFSMTACDDGDGNGNDVTFSLDKTGNTGFTITVSGGNVKWRPQIGAVQLIEILEFTGLVIGNFNFNVGDTVITATYNLSGQEITSGTVSFKDFSRYTATTVVYSYTDDSTFVVNSSKGSISWP